jgi:hypothetical protein
MFNEGNQIHNFMSSSGSGTVINYDSGSCSDFLTSYGSGYGSGSTSQKVTVPTVPVPQHCLSPIRIKRAQQEILNRMNPTSRPWRNFGRESVKINSVELLHKSSYRVSESSSV